MLKPSPSRVSARAFSLIEVIIAIGIFSFCIVSIVYLLGIALNSSQESQRDSAMTAMLRNVEAEMASLPASVLTNPAITNTYYFDYSGSITSNSAARIYRGTVKRVSTAKVIELTSVTNANNTTVPGGVSAGATNASNHFLWVLQVSYPAPNYPQTNTLIFGRALMGSLIDKFRE